MFRDMRRGRQLLSDIETKEIFNQGTSGVLALLGDMDYPYAVPLSYVFDDDKLYFHCAKSGHKLDAIANSDKASFCVIAEDNILAEKYTTLYKSAIAFGKVKVLTGEEMRKPIEMLAKKYAPDDYSGRMEEIDKLFDNMYMIEFTIEHMTGKQCIEYLKK